MKNLLSAIKFLIVFLLAACSFRSFAIYNDFKRHPDLYASYSAPWYTDIVVTVIITTFLIAISVAAYLIIKRTANKS